MNWRARTGRIRKAAADRLTQFFIDRHLRPDQPAAFGLPDRFPPHMLLYDRWLDERGMHPRDVDRLTRDELFWLPVIKMAKTDAAEQLAAIEAAKNKD